MQVGTIISRVNGCVWCFNVGFRLETDFRVRVSNTLGKWTSALALCKASEHYFCFLVDYRMISRINMLLAVSLMQTW